MINKQTIEEIVKKVDRKIEETREAEFYRLDIPEHGTPFDINAALAYENTPDEVVTLANRMMEYMKIVAVAMVLFFSFFFLFNANAYLQILSSNVMGVSEIAVTQDVEPEQELIVMSKDPVEQKQQFPELSLAVTPPDNRIIIPKLGKNVPIVEIPDSEIQSEDWTDLNEDVLEALKDGVVRYPGTAIPGQIGNTFITGHSSYYFWDEGDYKEVFALLPQLEIGDEVTLYYNQQKFTYRISEKREVSPSDVDVLDQPNDKKQLTLMTCTPVGTNLRRLILVGELI